MNTGTVTRISSQRTPFGEVFLEIFIGDKPYFTRQRTIGIMAMSAMLRPERKVAYAADDANWITAFALN